jgi:hypothetical protein
MAEQIAAPVPQANRWQALIVVLVVGGLLRLSWAWFFPNELYADSEWYYEQAINLAQNRGYLYQGQPSAIWPVGYPFFLSLIFRVTGPAPSVAKLANVLLLTIDLALIYGYARLTTTRASTPLATTWLIALMPTHIMAGSLIATESLFACCFHLQLLLLLWAIRRQPTWLWLLTGAMAGLLAYVRTEAGIFVLITVSCYGYVVWKRGRHTKVGWRPLAIAGLIGISALLVILPWTVRNVVKLGLWIPISTTGCMNLWIGNHAGADGSFAWPRDPALNPTLLREEDTEQSWYRRSCAAALAAIRQDPQRAVRLWPQKIYWLWKNDDEIVYWNFARTTREVAPVQVDLAYHSANLYYHLLLAGGLIGIVVYLIQFARQRLSALRVADPRAEVHAVGLLTLVAFTLVYLPFFGSARFHFALMPILALFAVEGFVQIYTQLQRGRAKFMVRNST